MARLILVLGKPGTGKSHSLSTLDPASTVILKPNAKPLPFRGSRKMYIKDKNYFSTKDLNALPGMLAWVNSQPHIKTYVIEDLSHFFSATTLSEDFRAKATGNQAFKRWADFGSAVYNGTVGADLENLREDLTIIIMHHTEIKDDGTVGSKSSGKLLDNEVMIDSHVTYLLHTRVVDGVEPTERYKFQTQFDGVFLCKTPHGVFDDALVPNDMQMVIDKINAFEYGEGEAAPQPVAEAAQ